jgi:hypothetical protein
MSNADLHQILTQLAWNVFFNDIRNNSYGRQYGKKR